MSARVFPWFRGRLTILAQISVLLFGLPVRSDEPDPTRLELKPRTITNDRGEYKAEVGRLKVPENRSKSDSRLIEIAFVRLKCTSKNPKSPVVFLAGGPGDTATQKARGPGWEPLLKVSDSILLDQRGTGESRPLLNWTPPDITPTTMFNDYNAALRTMVEVTGRAAKHLQSEGVDLTGYTTVENAMDVEDLRQALGIKKINLLAHSYGTHLGQEIVRRFGSNVAGFVSVGTAGMNDMYKLPAELDASLKKLARLVKADSRIGKVVPDMVKLFADLQARLAKSPLIVTVTDSIDGKRVDVPFGPYGLQFLLVRDLGDTADIPVLPKLLVDIDRGDTELLQRYLQKRYNQMRSVNGMSIVMRAASGATAERWAKIERQMKTSVFGAARLVVPREMAAAIGAPDLGDPFRKPVRSKVRALFVSGTLDANTPPAQAERVRKGFANSAHLIVENAGHEDLMGNRDVRKAVIQFFKGQAIEDATVKAPPIRFAPVN